jgi:hypothetical protein
MMKQSPPVGFAAAVLAFFHATAAADPSVVVSVSGLGRVVSDPPGISCPDACAAEFPAYSSVILHAKPDAGEKLLTWGGDCNSPTRSCKLYVDGEKIVQAGFSVGF